MGLPEADEKDERLAGATPGAGCAEAVAPAKASERGRTCCQMGRTQYTSRQGVRTHWKQVHLGGLDGRCHDVGIKYYWGSRSASQVAGACRRGR